MGRLVYLGDMPGTRKKDPQISQANERRSRMALRSIFNKVNIYHSSKARFPVGIYSPSKAS